MPTLPSYARLLYSGYSEQRQSAILRTEMEDGPPKQARIRSRVMVTRPVSIFVAARADYQSFIDWFSETLNEGVSWFDFVDPVSKTTKQARFVGGGLDASPAGPDMTLWTVTAKIETWG